ncbi:MAG: hypothetical protein MN733_23735 [Nitrososphaera sp.]|nr:hypothetical protein [Nitrososphaera sp.]
MAVEHIATGGVDEIQSRVIHYRDVFLKMEPIHGDDALFKTILILFPEVTVEDAPTVIDGLQRSLKPAFAEIGLMIGEFHENNDSPGLRNARFRPLRAPVPMLAIRHMVPTDLPFLVNNANQVGLYLDRFGEEGQVRLKAYLAQYTDGPRQEPYHLLLDELNRAQSGRR